MAYHQWLTILPLLQLLETESVIWPCIRGTFIYIMWIEDDLLLSFNTATEKSTPCNLVVSRLHPNPSPTLKLTFLLEGMLCFLLVSSCLDRSHERYLRPVRYRYKLPNAAWLTHPKCILVTGVKKGKER